MSNPKETFNPADYSLQDILKDKSLFSLYIDFIREQYLWKIKQSDVKTPQAWEIEDLKKDLQFDDLTQQTQSIFDDLTTGNLTDAMKAFRQFEIKATEKEIEKMNVEQLREIAINRTAANLAGKIYLARFIDKSIEKDKNQIGLKAALQDKGDISGSYWNEIGNTGTLIDIAKTGFDQWTKPHNFASALKNNVRNIIGINY